MRGSMTEPSDFERLMLEQLDSLWNYALNLTRRSDQAQDLLQDALARGFERFELFDRSLSFKAWMFTIIRHIHVDHLRKSDALRPETPEWLAEGAAEISESPLYAIPLDPEAILAHRESVERLQEAIRHLPAEIREKLTRVLADLTAGTRALPRRALRKRVAVAAVAALFVAVGAGAALLAESVFRSRGSLVDLAEAAVEQHQRLTRDVLPPDIHGVSPKIAEVWVRKRLSFNTSLTDFARERLTLRGGPV